MKILIATDGSDFSHAAIETTCKMIRNAENTSIKVVSVYQQPMMTAAAPYTISAGYNPALEQELKEFAMQNASQAEQEIRKYFPDLENKISTHVLCGSPAQTIIEEAENWGADLIVVGSHGYGFWERMFLGSVSNTIVHHAPCSVLVVRKRRNSDVEYG